MPNLLALFNVYQVDAAAEELVYPLTYTARGATRALYQDGTEAATDRLAVGLMDASHQIGFDSGNLADTDPPAANYLSRTEANQEMLDAHPTGEHWHFTYHNVTEAHDETTEPRREKIKDYLDGLNGPGVDDGWAYNSSNAKVILFGTQYTINLSDHVAESAGLTYPEWYADEIVKLEFFDVHVAAGVPVGGIGACNVFLDNHQLFSNKSGIDWDNDGSNDDAQDYFDSEEAAHVTADAVATNAYSEVRANMRKGPERWDAMHSGHVTMVNTNQWAQDVDRATPTDPADLRNCILEYRLDGNEDQAYVKSGFSENNSGTSFPRSGVNQDGTNSGQFGEWLLSYCNTYQSARLCQWPKIVACSFRVECLQTGAAGDAGITIYPNAPSSSAKFHMARWAMVTAWLAGAHTAVSGVKIGTETAGRGTSTPIFDEMGLINGSIDYNSFGSGNTKLYRKWMGVALEDPPTAVKADGSWQREFTNALIILNPDDDEANDPISIDVSALPGGASEWTRFVGDQDNTINDGSDASSDFDMEPIDAIVLARKSWYDAL